MIGGFSDPTWAVKHAPGLKPYAEPNGEFYGAYGQRIGRQLSEVHAKLRGFPLTRQAIITLWDPAKDNEPNHMDYPCTIAIGFSLTGHALDRLNMRVQMRSNDAWLGLPYDLFQFGQLQLTLANVLGVTPGRYTHSAWSLHLYEHDVPESYNVVESPPIALGDAFRARQPIGFGCATDSIEQVQAIVRAIVAGSASVNPTDSERWYVDALAE